MMNRLLEAEELAFLAELMARESEEHQAVAVQLPQASPLMPLLSQAQGLSLKARFQHHELRFPVRLRINELLQPELVFDAPEILEIGPTHRKWRFRPDERLRLLDEAGNDSGLAVVDLSDSSLSLKTHDEGAALPEQLNLQLELPDGGDRLALSARRVRDLGDGHAAYQVEMEDDAQEDRLRWYLFNRHPATLAQREHSPETAEDTPETASP